MSEARDRLSEKLFKFLRDEGRLKSWAAGTLGMGNSYFSLVCSGRHGVPPKYWIQLLELTKGYLTFYDLISCYLEGIEFLEIEEDKKTGKVSLQILKKK